MIRGTDIYVYQAGARRCSVAITMADNNTKLPLRGDSFTAQKHTLYSIRVLAWADLLRTRIAHFSGRTACT